MNFVLLESKSAANKLLKGGRGTNLFPEFFNEGISFVQLILLHFHFSKQFINSLFLPLYRGLEKESFKTQGKEKKLL